MGGLTREFQAHEIEWANTKKYPKLLKIQTIGISVVELEYTLHGKEAGADWMSEIQCETGPNYNSL